MALGDCGAGVGFVVYIIENIVSGVCTEHIRIHLEEMTRTPLRRFHRNVVKVAVISR